MQATSRAACSHTHTPLKIDHFSIKTHLNRMGLKQANNSSGKSNIIQKVGNFARLMFYVVYSYTKLVFRFFVPAPMKSLDGEIILITGSSSGIGKQVVLNLARNHPKTILVLWDTNVSLNLETAAEAKALGATVHTYNVDVANVKKVKSTAEKVKDEVGHPTVLINNAAVALGSLFLTCPEEDLEKTVQVNLISHFWTLRSFLPQMIKNNKGHIVTTGSLGSFFGHRSCIPYYAAKFGIRGYIESLQDELRSLPQKTDNIHFTTIFPSFVETPLTVNSKTAVGLGNKGYLKADFVAQKIVEGIRRNEEKVFIPNQSQLLILIAGLMPSTLFWEIRQYIISDDRKTE